MLLNSFILLAGLGLVAAVMLTVASKFFYVQEDPRVAKVLDALPGANCGGCGYAGCEGYAIAVVNEPAIPASLCCAGGPDTAAKVGDLTGKAAGGSEPQKAFRRCEKVEGNVAQRFEYSGIDTCAAAAKLDNGETACTYACLGYGDCLRVCQFNALVMVNGMPQVLGTNCTGCGNCIKACPRNIMQLVPKRVRIMVHCSTQDKLKAVTDVCGVGCISCMKCVKACPAKALSLLGGRIEVDQAACLAYGDECREACVDSCPRKILRREFEPQREEIAASAVEQPPVAETAPQAQA